MNIEIEQLKGKIDSFEFKDYCVYKIIPLLSELKSKKWVYYAFAIFFSVPFFFLAYLTLSQNIIFSFFLGVCGVKIFLYIKNKLKKKVKKTVLIALLSFLGNFEAKKLSFVASFHKIKELAATQILPDNWGGNVTEFICGNYNNINFEIGEIKIYVSIVPRGLPCPLDKLYIKIPCKYKFKGHTIISRRISNYDSSKTFFALDDIANFRKQYLVKIIEKNKNNISLTEKFIHCYMNLGITSIMQTAFKDDSIYIVLDDNFNLKNIENFSTNMNDYRYIAYVITDLLKIINDLMLAQEEENLTLIQDAKENENLKTSFATPTSDTKIKIKETYPSMTTYCQKMKIEDEIREKRAKKSVLILFLGCVLSSVIITILKTIIDVKDIYIDQSIDGIIIYLAFVLCTVLPIFIFMIYNFISTKK